MPLIRKLALELSFQGGDHGDERRGGLLEGFLRSYGAVGLDLYLEVRVEGMGDLVPGEENVGGGEELAEIKGVSK